MSSKQNRQRGSDLPELAKPAQRALAAAGIHRLEQLVKFSEGEIKQLHGIGPNALNDLRRALRECFEGHCEKRPLRRSNLGLAQAAGIASQKPLAMTR